MRPYILLTIFTLFSCKKERVDNTSSIAISTIVDITDPFDLGPDANAILSLYRFPENENQEAYFRFLSITDKGLNPCLEYQIEDGTKSQLDYYGLDYQLRKKLIVGFYGSSFWKRSRYVHRFAGPLPGAQLPFVVLPGLLLPRCGLPAISVRLAQERRVGLFGFPVVEIVKHGLEPG